MPFASLLLAACLGARMVSGSPSDPLLAIHQQRYSMGTMFDIVVYHLSRADAEDAVARALDEIALLDGVMSHYRADSALSRLVRDGRGAFVVVPRSLYEVVERAGVFSQRSGGRFDITVAPLVRLWKAAAADGRTPSDPEIARARRCVGFERIELLPPDRIRLRGDCVELDLGGIGKGYAVDRALAILRAAGIRHAMVNAGGSSIAAFGAAPGRDGWPVALQATSHRGATILLRDQSISTSQQGLAPPGQETGEAGEIIDTRTAAPIAGRSRVSVMAPSAADSDALSTTLLMLSVEEGAGLLASFAGTSAFWLAPDGTITATCRTPALERVVTP